MGLPNDDRDPTSSRARLGRLFPRGFALSLSLSLSLSSSATTTDATPELRNSPRLNTPERLKTDPFGGTAAYAYQIDVPPGTAGMTPQLVLTYSTQTQHSEYGYGWTLNLPYIERSTREHRPFYHDPGSVPAGGGDEFELAGDLLVRDPSPGSPNRFHLRYADGSRILWDEDHDRWEVTKPDGTRQLFGSTAYSRIFRNADTPAETFRWSLSEVIDPRGNLYRVFYQGDADVAGQGPSAIQYNTYIYPLLITYTHSVHSAPALQSRRTIEFEWVARANAGESDLTNEICDGKEDCPTSYRAGFKVQRRKRLARIAVGIDAAGDGLDSNEEVRSYAFSYTDKASIAQPENPPFSQLEAIQRHGQGGVPFPESSNPLATEFTYSRPPRKFQDEGGEWAATPGMISEGQLTLSGHNWHNRIVIDLNGDGLMDRVEVIGTPAQHAWNVYLGRIVEGPEGPEPGGFDLSNPIPWTFDCTGPGSAEDICAAALSEHIQHGRQHNGFTWQASDLIDMDGDLLPDRVVGGAYKALTVYRNHGSGFGPAESWATPGVPGNEPYVHPTQGNSVIADLNSPTHRFLVDVNGDGRPEYWHLNGFEVNTGSGFAQTTGTAMEHPFPGLFNMTASGIDGRWYQLLDVNGDGIPDHVPYLVCFTSARWVSFGLSLADTASWQHLAGLGHENQADGSWCPDYSWPNYRVYPESRWDAEVAYAAMIDLNGDGIRDYVWGGAYFATEWTVYFGLG